MKYTKAIILFCLSLIVFLPVRHAYSESPGTPSTDTLQATTSAGAEAEQATPRVVVPQATFTFEGIYENDYVSHDFILKNTGTAPLDIIKVKPGWGCTTVSFTKQIPPGGEGKISLRVNTKNYGGRLLKKNIKVTCSDPKQKDLTLTIMGHVKALADIRPKRIRFSVKLNEPVSRTVTITPDKAFPFKILGHSFRKHNELKSTLSDKGNHYEVTILFPSDKPGSFNDTLLIKTDNAKLPEIKVPISGYVIKPQVKANNDKAK